MGRGRRYVAGGAAAIVAVQAIVVMAFLFSRASGTDSALMGLPLDDGWIHLVYARNLAAGGELAYNPGEPEVGITSPLWVVLLSPAASMAGHGPAVAAKVLSALCAIALCLLAAALARDLAGDVAGIVAALVIAFDPHLAFSAASGMEISLAAALIMATLLAIRKRRVALAGLLLGLAWLARPESGALLAVVLPWIVVLARGGELRWNRVALGGLLVVLVVAPFVAYCLSVTGHPLPNTFYLKGGFTPWPADGLWVLLRGVLMPSMVVGFGGAFGFYLAGFRWLAKRGTKHRPDAVALLAAPWVFLFAVLFSRAFSVAETHTFYFIRYFHPALPLLAVAIGCGAGSLARWVREARKKKERKRRRQRAKIIAIAAMAAALLCVVLNLSYAMSRFSWNAQNIEEMQVAAGQWIARETPPDAVVAASDAGAVRFFGQRRVIDLMALNYHPAVDAVREGRVPLSRIMRDEAPTHIAVLSTWFPDIERGGRARLVFEARAEQYTVAAARQDRFVVYEVLRR